MNLQIFASKPLVVSALCAFLSNGAFAVDNVELTPLRPSASSLDLSSGVLHETATRFVTWGGNAYELAISIPHMVRGDEIVDAGGREVPGLSSSTSPGGQVDQITSSVGQQVADAAVSAGISCWAACYNRAKASVEGTKKNWGWLYDDAWKVLVPVTTIASIAGLSYGIYTWNKESKQNEFARAELNQLPAGSVHIDWHNANISFTHPNQNVIATNSSIYGTLVTSNNLYNEFQTNLQNKGLYTAIDEYRKSLGYLRGPEDIRYVPNANGTQIDIWMKYTVDGQAIWTEVPSIKTTSANSTLIDMNKPRFGGNRRGLEEGDPNTNEAQSASVTPQDSIDSSPILSGMQACFKVHGQAYKECVDKLFKPVTLPTQINVDQYGLINPGPSGVYSQGWEDYAYTYDPTGVRGTANPLVRVNLSTMGGNFSDQVINRSGLVQVSIGGSAINAPQRHEPRDCRGTYDYILFPECGLVEAGPGVDPRRVTYPTDDVINYARQVAYSPSSYSLFGTPNCNYNFTGIYNLKWQIQNSGCNLASSTLALNGGGQWQLSALFTLAQRNQMKADADRKRSEILNQPRPDMPNDIPLFVYKKAWEKYPMAMGTGYGSGSQLLGGYLEQFSLENDGNVYCTKTGIYQSTVWCNQAVPLSALDLLYDYRLSVAGMEPISLNRSEMSIALANFSNGLSDRNKNDLISVASSGGQSLAQLQSQTTVPDNVAAWAIYQLSSKCWLGSSADNPPQGCLGTTRDKTGAEWSVSANGLLTNRATGKGWKLLVPEQTPVAAFNPGALQSVLIQNPQSGMTMIASSTSTDTVGLHPVASQLLVNQWSLVPHSGGGGFKVVQRDTGRVLTPQGFSKQAGVPLVVAKDVNDVTQIWNLQPIGADWQYGFKLVNVASGLVLTPDAWSVERGNKLIQWYDENRNEQIWQGQQLLTLKNKANDWHAVATSSTNYPGVAASSRSSYPVYQLAIDDSNPGMGIAGTLVHEWFVRRVPDSSAQPNKFARRLVVISTADGRALSRIADEGERAELAARSAAVKMPDISSTAVVVKPYKADDDSQRWVLDYRPDGSFTLTSALDGKRLTASGDAQGLSLGVDTAMNSAAQQWLGGLLTDVKNDQTGQVFYPQETNLDLLQNRQAKGVRYRFEPTGDGFFRILNGRTGKVLTPNAWSDSDGTLVIHWDAAKRSDSDEYRKRQHWGLKADDNGGYRIVNRVSGLAITPSGDAYRSSLIARQVDLANRKQVWRLESLIPYIEASQRPVPVDVIEQAWIKRNSGDNSPFTDWKGNVWDFTVDSGSVAFSRRDQPLMNFSLLSPARNFATDQNDPGNLSANEYGAPYWMLPSSGGAVWLQDRSSKFSNCCVRARLQEFALMHPEVDFALRWVGIGQAIPPLSSGTQTALFKRGTTINTDGSGASFKGRRFALYGSGGPGAGSFDVYLDGTKIGPTVAPAQLYTSPAANVPLFDSGNMPASWRDHKVEVRNRQGAVTITKLEYVPN